VASGADVSTMKINDAIFDKFFTLLMKLEPKNIWMDGEVTNPPVSRAEVKKRETAIFNQWEDLEYLIGRKVSQDEIWQRYATQRISL